MTVLPYDTLLTLTIPVSLEEDLLDFLLTHPKWAGGFTVVAAQGLGQGAPLATTMELVHGRSARKLVLIAGRQPDLALLLAALAAEIPSPHVAYWTSPLQSCGRLA